VDNVTWIHGKHTLRAGLNFRFYIHNDSRGSSAAAWWNPSFDLTGAIA